MISNPVVLIENICHITKTNNFFSSLFLKKGIIFATTDMKLSDDCILPPKTKRNLLVSNIYIYIYIYISKLIFSLYQLLRKEKRVNLLKIQYSIEDAFLANT